MFEKMNHLNNQCQISNNSINTSISRRDFVKKTAVACTGTVPMAAKLNASLSNSHNSSKNQNNILLLVSDDHGLPDLGCYGNPTNYPLALLGITNFELRDGLIVNEWMVVDETAVYAQIAAYELAKGKVHG